MQSALAQSDVPYLRHTRFTCRPFDVEHDDILARLGVAVKGMLIPGTAAIAKIPTPTGDLADGLVLECDQTPVHVEDLETPARLDGLLELRFQRHQSEFVQE